MKLSIDVTSANADFSVNKIMGELSPNTLSSAEQPSAFEEARS
jgi:hypothetical protein